MKKNVKRKQNLPTIASKLLNNSAIVENNILPVLK